MVPVSEADEDAFAAAMNAANELWSSGRLSEARGALEGIAATWPRRADPLLLLGMVLLAQQEDERAEQVLAEAVRWAPDDGVVWFRHAEALALRGRFDRAIPALTAAIERSPEEARPYIALARLLDAGGQRSQATAVLEMGREVVVASALIEEELRRRRSTAQA